MKYLNLKWLPREEEIKDHSLHGSQHWSDTAPRTIYEKRPLKDLEGNVIDNLFVAVEIAPISLGME